MTDGLDEGPTEEDRRLAADHDDEGVDVALAIARAARGEPAGTPRRCLLYTSPSPRDATLSRMPSSA